MASTTWTNILLKSRDVVPGKIKDSMSVESFMDLKRTSPSSSLELFSEEAVEKAVKKSSRLLHAEAICKAVTPEKLTKKSRRSFSSPNLHCSLTS